jgi:DHA2 family multidrug resistance protein
MDQQQKTSEANVSQKKRGLEQKWKVLISVVFGIFMVILDTTVVNVAFQTLRTEFGASINDSQWIISVYVLSLGISTPLAGYLGDRYGMKRIYLLGLSIFILGSLLCGFSPSLPFLIGARALQGFGGGIALPLGTALLFRSFPANEQGMALGIFGIASLTAPALGPILGGYLVDQNLWRFIFFINPPIGLVGVILGTFFLPSYAPERKPNLDVFGLITEIIGFGSVLYAASIAANKGWTDPEVLTWFGIGFVGMIAFAIVELRYAKEPLLDLRLFTKRTFLNASLLGYVSVIALFGAEFLMPIYLQSLRGKSAMETGLTIVPMAVTGALATITAGRLYDRVGPRLLVGFGYTVLLINTWQLSKIKGDTPISWIMFLLALRGLAVGSTVQTTFVTALSVVPLRQVARGSSLANATRQVVQSIGVAFLATILASALSPEINAILQKVQDVPAQSAGFRIALCEPTPVAATGKADPSTRLDGNIPQISPGVFQKACQENIAGFEHAYRITFYAAGVALILGLMLPGWPLKWAGRRAADENENTSTEDG